MTLTGRDLPRALTRVSVVRAVAVFLLAGLLALVAVTALLVIAQRRTAASETIRDARTLTNLEAHDVVGPLLSDAALVPGPAYDRLDSVVRARVLGAWIVRVKVWDATGSILYSDDPTLVGRRFPLPPDELQALRTGQTLAEASDLQEAENAHERQFGKLLQVYLGVRTPEGRPLLFETYQPYHVLRSATRRIWLASLPALLGGVVLLYIAQAPLAYRMASRLRAVQDEREQLLIGSLAASDRERSRIAADLHDGVVQGLVGASYTLDAASRTPCCPDQEERSATLHRTAVDLRRWVRELRSLIVTVTPPALHAQGLHSSLADLLATLESRGIDATLEADGIGTLPEDVEALAYRVAQEAVRNIIRHADARNVQVTLRLDCGRLVRVRLEVRDDGRGFDPAATSRRHGSVGLGLLSTVVAAQGGQLTIASSPDTGTVVLLTATLTAHESRSADVVATAGAEPAGTTRART